MMSQSRQAGSKGVAAKQRFVQLLHCLSRIFAEEGRPGGDATAQALTDACASPWHDPDPNQWTPNFDVRHLLASAKQSPDATVAGLAQAMDDAHDTYFWNSSKIPSLQPGTQLGDGILTAHVIGPEYAPAFHPTIKVGFFYQAANLNYPARSHAAEETYFLVSGTGHWSADHEPPQPQAPGQFIHHASLVPHSSTTDDHPIIAVWRWSGDISTDSYRLFA